MRARVTWLFITAVLLTYAVPTAAVDMFAYFRDGFTLNSKGGGATCFKTPGMDYKLRLGNECDNYGEWGLEQSIYKDKNGVEVKAGVMFAYDQDVATPGGAKGTPFGIQQNYFKMKFPQWGGAQVWGGKQYYRRENIDMIDFFYLNTSDTGIGVEDVDLGFGKLAFSIFGAAGSQAHNGMVFIRPDVRVYGIPVNPNGTLEVDLNVTAISRNTDTAAGGVAKGDNDASAGFWGTVEHVQKGILNGNGSNTLAIQFATANAANMGGAAPGFSVPGASDAEAAADAINKNNQQLRILDQLILQPTNQFQILVGGVYQHKVFGLSDGSKVTANQIGIFTRPKYWFTDYFLIQGDLGYTSDKFDKGFTDNMTLVKGTIAPTLAPMVGEAGGFFVRPEFRVFVTYANWNDASNKAPGFANGASSDVNFGPDKKSGLTYGAQVEGWF